MAAAGPLSACEGKDQAGTDGEAGQSDRRRGHTDAEGRCQADHVCSDARSAPASIVINEVESRGGSPGDWVELHNAGSVAIELSGYRIKDSDDSHTFYTLPAGTRLAAGGFLVLEEATLGFGLGGADSVRLYAPRGDAPVASYGWSAHADTTYGRCPGSGATLRATSAATKGATNGCAAVAATGMGGELAPGLRLHASSDAMHRR
jgi:hypothetical protein